MTTVKDVVQSLKGITKYQSPRQAKILAKAISEKVGGLSLGYGSRTVSARKVREIVKAVKPAAKETGVRIKTGGVSDYKFREKMRERLLAGSQKPAGPKKPVDTEEFLEKVHNPVYAPKEAVAAKPVEKPKISGSALVRQPRGQDKNSKDEKEVEEKIAPKVLPQRVELSHFAGLEKIETAGQEKSEPTALSID